MASSGFGETAYTALRLVGTQKGDEILNQVLEVSGDGGREPAAWKIVVSDPRAKEGAREIEVRDGRITGDSAPRNPMSARRPMDLNLLNLDSGGVLAIVNQESDAAASAERFSYTLSNGAESGTPVWTVKLQPPQPGLVTSMKIAADTGAVIANAAQSVPSDAQSLAGRGQPAAVDPRNPVVTESSEDIPVPEKEAGKRSASHSRDGVGDVPDLAKHLIRKAEKPVRFLRRFLP